MLSVVIEAFKKSVMFLCTPFANCCLVCSDWAFTPHSSPARIDGIHPMQIHLITAVSAIKRLSLYEFTLWGWDLGCVPLGWFGSRSAIWHHLDHGRSNEPMNPCPEWIHRFIQSTMIRVISITDPDPDHLKGTHT